MKRFFLPLSTFYFLLSISVLAASFPPPQGYVNDFAQMLSSQTRKELEQNLAEFERQTGNEIAIATIPSLEGDTVENYAVKLFEEWKIGKKGSDNGVLLLIARDEHKIRIEAGYGLEPTLTDARSGDIIRNDLTPAFKAGDYDGGVLAAVRDIEAAIRGGAISGTGAKSPSGFIGGLSIAGLLILYLLFRTVLYVLAVVPGYWLGPLVGLATGTLLGAGVSIIYFTLFGLLMDIVVSRQYMHMKKLGRPITFWTFWGGWGGGGKGFGGGGGFGGGSSGGGGASGGW